MALVIADLKKSTEQKMDKSVQAFKADLGKARELAQAGDNPGTLALVEASLAKLSRMPLARPGVADLRDDFEDLRDRCAGS